MNLQVLVATMNQNDYSLLDRMKINSDTIISNQCNSMDYSEMEYHGNRIQMISTKTIGVGLNRNIGLMFSNADILLFADDDIVYKAGYEKEIIDEFKKNKKADGIFFRFKFIRDGKVYDINHKKRGVKRGRIYNTLGYGTYNLAVKREFLQKNNIKFSELFGGGSVYGSGEDSLLILDLLRNGAKLYISDIIIGDNYKDKSSWFTGYNKKYFFDNGAFIKCAFPHSGWLIKWYYIFAFSKISELNIIERKHCIKAGMRAFLSLRRYSDEAVDSFK
ncbi:glycosyltransferase family 2 protein [Pseudobutyrivibrio xylanivorans]|uniref:Glycosyl transferase family 2 n=1 Tax=Pseudobutyrivibrio xylanivorans TaxID=185007 RepID=A0A1G5S4E1_PSEXY|nr:glycosyltransferase family A protein [Pseudobutyrivibrio xylanivorans]SCZ81234.1 Glycosyl transferase family 2 [Pseudobutyrivibrio xylanivorans]